jgi:hypothetical protein
MARVPGLYRSAVDGRACHGLEAAAVAEAELSVALRAIRIRFSIAPSCFK